MMKSQQMRLGKTQKAILKLAYQTHEEALGEWTWLNAPKHTNVQRNRRYRAADRLQERGLLIRQRCHGARIKLTPAGIELAKMFALRATSLTWKSIGQFWLSHQKLGL